MHNALTQAIIAADQQDWTGTLNSLHQLPLADGDALSQPERERGLTLALAVLNRGDFQQQWDVAKLIPRWGQAALHPLLALLESDRTDADTRWFISRILSQLNHPASICALIQLLQQTDDDDLAAMASESLAQLGNNAIASLIDLLGEDRYRLLALKALAQIPHPDTLDPFCAATNDPSPAIRAIAITALGNVSRDDLMPIFLQALQDPDPKVRQAAVTALGVRNSARWQLVPHLTPLLADPFSTVAEQAAIALGRIGTIEAADALFPVLKSLATPPSLKLTLVRSLGWMTHPKALHYLGIALHWCDHPICIAIIQALATQEQPELRAIATQILLEFLTAAQHHSQDPAIRQQTALALGELGDPTALSYLETLAQDPNLQIRLHAQAALRKVLATPSPP